MFYTQKTVVADLDFGFDFAPVTNGKVAPGSGEDWLEPGEIIADYTLSAEPGITIDAGFLMLGDTQVGFRLTGGTAGEKYNITCRIETTAIPPRIEERTMVVRCIQAR